MDNLKVSIKERVEEYTDTGWQDLNKKGLNFLIYDFGLSVEHAVRIAKDGNNVKYFTPYIKAFPQFEDYAFGLGIEGIDKVKTFFDEVDTADILMFPDIGAGDLCDYFKKQGRIVYGAGKRGEDLENHRFETRKLQFKLGLPTQKTILVKGVEGIRNYFLGNLQKEDFEYIEGQKGIKEFLQQKGNVFVKLDVFRGDVDSFYGKDYDSVELILDEIESSFGPFKNEYNFVIEEAIEGLEPGLDLFFNGQEFLKPYILGYEHDKACYVGFVTNELPTSLQRVLEKLTPVLREMNYQGAISLEFKIPKTREPYLIDFCCRFPYPLSAVYTLAIKNYTEVITNIALGKLVNLDIQSKYIACLPLNSSKAEKRWVKLDFDEKLRDKIKIRMACKVSDNYYGVRGMETVFVLVTEGDDIDKIIKELSELSDKVNAPSLNKDVVGGLNFIKEDIKKGYSLGINFK